MITAEHLTKRYASSAGEVTALEDVNFRIDDGEIVAIVGQSGSGKSTLIRLLTGLAQPTVGTVELDGRAISGLDERELREVRARIGLVFQHANLLDNRTARKNIEYPLEIARWTERSKRARSQELLELVGLADRGDQFPSQLSGGQQQRVGIARALAAHPSVLICDEPTSALDGQTTQGLLDLLKNLRDELGVTLVIVTHDLSVVRRIADRVIELEHGSIIREGDVTDFATDLRTALLDDVLQLSGPDPRRLIVSGADELANTPFITELSLALDTKVSLVSGGAHQIGDHLIFRGELQLPDEETRDSAREWLSARGFTAVAR